MTSFASADHDGVRVTHAVRRARLTDGVTHVFGLVAGVSGYVTAMAGQESLTRTVAKIVTGVAVAGGLISIAVGDFLQKRDQEGMRPDRS